MLKSVSRGLGTERLPMLVPCDSLLFPTANKIGIHKLVKLQNRNYANSLNLQGFSKFHNSVSLSKETGFPKLRIVLLIAAQNTYSSRYLLEQTIHSKEIFVV